MLPYTRIFAEKLRMNCSVFGSAQGRTHQRRGGGLYPATAGTEMLLERRPDLQTDFYQEFDEICATEGDGILQSSMNNIIRGQRSEPVEYL